MTDSDATPPPDTYEVRVRGHFGEAMRRAFSPLSTETEGHDTVLRGPLSDQASLYGVLSQVEAFGLELVEVRRLPSG